MGNIIIAIMSLINIVTISIKFFSNERVESAETKIYEYLLYTILCESIIGIILFYCLEYSNGIFPYLINWVYIVTMIMWAFFFTIYMIRVSEKNDELFDKTKKILLSLTIIEIIISLLLPRQIEIADNGNFYASGLSITSVYIYSAICIICLFCFLIKNRSNLRDRRFLPVPIFFASAIIVMFIQGLYPELFLFTPVEAFIVFVMFFTIENPDVKMIEQLDFAKKQADKANQAKTDFLSNMSHEIRTPLNAIVGFSQALSEEDCLNDQAQDEVKDIMMASENLLEIVNGILDISKIESGKLEIIAKDYSFKKVWDEVVALGRGRLGDKPLEFKTFYDESIPEVLYGDSTRIKEVIVNLLTNAIKYTKEGFVELKVSSVIKDDVCRLIISVEDSGIGIKQENIEKLFTKFERIGVEKEITIEGTGLGLAITKKLVDLMNGTIVVQSIYGKGSKFTVSIDQKIQVGHHLEETQNINLEEMTTMDLSNKRVLVVDDNMVNLKVAARLLKDYNLIIDEVDNGMDCINKVMSDTKYDLILMDDMMPKMSGTETLHNLKDIDGFNIPTIALTANAISGMREKYLSEGFNDYLAKPIDRKELNKIIKKYLGEEKSE